MEGNGAEPVGAFSNRTFNVALWLFAVVLCVVVVLKSPYFAFHHIEFIGRVRLDETDVLSATRFEPGQSLFSLDLGGGENRLRTLPIVEDVRLRRKLPGTLQVIVTERLPRAWLATPVGFWAVDKDGFALFQSDKLALTLPLVTMDPVMTPTIGQAMKDPGLLKALDFSGALTVTGMSAVSEIHVGLNGLTAYTHDGTSIDLGLTGDMAEKARVLEGLLKEIERGRLAVVHIDLRHASSPAVRHRN